MVIESEKTDDIRFQHISEHTLLSWSPVTGLELDHGQETRSHELVRHLEQSTPAEEEPEDAHCRGHWWCVHSGMEIVCAESA
jgi:hypothetical protein